NLAGAWVPCATAVLQDDGTPSPLPGSTLVVSWGDAGYPQNGRVALHGTPECDANCQKAVYYAGAGTTNARALNCQTATANGIVALQLVYKSGAWYHYNLNGQLVPCVGSSTLVANWGAIGNPNATLRLCDDYNNHPACAAAASYAGNGTAQAKALNCL